MIKPDIPADHPLYDYTTYMMAHVDRVYAQLWYLILAVTFLGITFAVFAFQKWLERQEIKTVWAEVRNLLAVVKGWTAVNTSTLGRSTLEVKDEIAKVPNATAMKVVEAVNKDGGFQSLSGVLKPVVPESPPSS